MSRNQNNAGPKTMKASVKCVLSGDTVVLCHPNHRHIEKTFTLSSILAPRFARRNDSEEEPFAFEARECLRKLLVGKQVTFQVHTTNKSSGRDYGVMYVSSGNRNVNVASELVSQGFAKVKELGGRAAESEEYIQLVNDEKYAKDNALGLHSEDKKYIKKHTRKIQWTIPDSNKFLEKYGKKETKVIVESCLTGSKLSVLTPGNEVVLLSLTGIQCPNVRYEMKEKDGKKDRVMIAQPFGKEALQFTEAKFLQKEVRVLFEAADKGDAFIGTILNDDNSKYKTFQELLLSQGFAKIAPWSIHHTKAAKDLNEAETIAKEGKLRIFKNYVPPKKTVTEEDQNSYKAKLVDIISGDSLKVLNMNTGKEEKISLSSIKSQRFAGSGRKPEPYAVEARHMLRKKVAGKVLHVKCDYRREIKIGGSNEETKEEDQQLETRKYCTVTVNKKNVALGLVKNGYATVIKHKYGEERSPDHSKLVTAEDEAKKTKRGIHGSKKEYPTYNFNDLSRKDSSQLQKFLSLIKDNKNKAVVERVFSAARFKIFLPKDSMYFTFTLYGMGVPSFRSEDEKVVAVSKEGTNFSNDKCNLQDVEIVVRSVDNRGNFTGDLFLSNGDDLSKLLLAEGYVFCTGLTNKLKHSKELYDEEQKAKKAKKNIWTLENFFKPKESAKDANSKDIVLSSKDEPAKIARVTAVSSPNELYYQTQECAEHLSKIDELIENMSLDYVKQSSKFKEKDLCIAKFSEDGSWYRARVVKTNKNTTKVLFIDYGNIEEVPKEDLRALEKKSDLGQIPAQAQRITLAYTKAHREEYKNEATEMLTNLTADKDFELFFEYQIKRQRYCSLIKTSEDLNINAEMLKNGLLFFDAPEFLKDKEDFKSKLDFLEKKHLEGKNNKKGLYEMGDIYEEEEEEQL